MSWRRKRSRKGRWHSTRTPIATTMTIIKAAAVITTSMIMSIAAIITARIITVTEIENCPRFCIIAWRGQFLSGQNYNANIAENQAHY